MAVLVSPGVLTREIDLSLYVPAITSTILGLVGTATRGLLDTVQLVTDVTQLAETYGPPDPNHPAILTAQWYLKFGRQLLMVRVANPDTVEYATSELTTSSDGPGIVTGAEVGPFTVDAATSAEETGSENGPFVLTEASPGGLTGTEVGPFAITGGVNDAFTVAVDGGGNQAITLTAGGSLTAQNIADDINLQTTGLTASDEGGAVKIVSNTTGASSSIKLQTVSNDCYTTLGLNTTIHNGAAGNNAFKIAVDGGSDQTVTLTPGTRTTQQVVDDLNSGTTDLTASVVAGQVHLASNTTGGSSSLNIKSVAGDSYTVLGFSTGPIVGDAGTDLLILSVSGGPDQEVTLPAGSNTSTEIMDAINDAVTGVTASVSANALTLTTGGTGSAVSIQVKNTGTAQTLLGFDTSVHNGSDEGDSSISISANTPGTWGNDLSVKMIASQTFPGTVNLIVMYRGYTEEVWRNLTKDVNVPTRYWPNVINGHSRFITVTDNTGVGGQPQAGGVLFTFDGGDDGLTGITDANYIGEQGDGFDTGLMNFAEPNKFDVNLVCIPGQTSMNVHAAEISMCTARGDCMCILDPPSGLTPLEVVDFKRGLGTFSDRVALNSNYAAMYYPWVKGYDTTHAVVVDLPPSAAAIRTYIYNDTVGELWFAPMGVNRGLVPEVVGIERKLREGEKDYVYENGINPIMSYTTYGITVMGEKTLQVAPTALDRVNVRRMLLYLRKVASLVYFPLIGEPNTPRLWRRAVRLLQPTLQYVTDREGITQYQVVCDSSTNPQHLVNAHELHIKIGILPTADAEFIYVDFVIVDSMTTFQEYLAPAA